MRRGKEDDLKNNVKIALVSKQFDGSDAEQVELFTEGVLKMHESGYELHYDETEATGYEGSVTKLRVSEENRVEMLRSGSTVASLVVELGRKHHCHYGTPYGDFMVGVTAKEIHSDITKAGGTLNFRYVIDVNSSYIGDFEIDINVKPISTAIEQ